MNLERFNYYGQQVEFNTATGIGSICGDGTDRPTTNPSSEGIAALVNGNWLALYLTQDELVLQWSKTEINLEKDTFTLEYVHLNGGITSFRILSGNKELLSLSYPSWWTDSEFVAGLGAGPDEEQDFCAYLKLMISNKKSREHLRKMFSKRSA